MSNELNSSVYQAVLDVLNTSKKDSKLAYLGQCAAVLLEAMDNTDESVIRSADAAFKSHTYPDKAFDWVKMPVLKGSLVPFDTMSSDEWYLMSWLVRRFATFSPFVAFRINDLITLGFPFSKRKLASILKSVQDKGYLVACDRTMDKTLGTVYMICPEVLNVSGTPAANGRYLGIYHEMTAAASYDEARPCSVGLDLIAGCPTIDIVISNNRVRVNCLSTLADGIDNPPSVG